MLDFNNVSFSYDKKTPILENVSFQIKQRDFVSLIGQSGTGKSTIFRLILGFENVDKGNININSKMQKIGYMPQKDLLFPWRTIEENLALPQEVLKKNKNEIKKNVNQILEEMDLIHTKKLYPSELSGGMRQRISFARTVLTGADLLLLDEPFSALDYFTRMEFQDWILNQYQRLNKTIFFITHSVEEAILLSNKIFILEEGNQNGVEEIKIEKPYPRTQEFLYEKDMIDLKLELLQKLTSSKVNK